MCHGLGFFEASICSAIVAAVLFGAPSANANLTNGARCRAALGAAETQGSDLSAKAELSNSILKIRSAKSALTLPRLSKKIRNGLTPRQIANALIERLQREETTALARTPAPYPTVEVDVWKASTLILVFSSQHIDSIARRGFLNQHQTRRSGGVLRPDHRAMVENQFLGIDLGDSRETASLRPKSALLSIDADVQLPEYSGEGIWNRYGNVGAVMKDPVKKRAAWTLLDSDLLWDSLFFHIQSSHELIYRYFGSFNRNTLPSPRLGLFGGSYFEALIYGDVTLDDVELFVVRSRGEASQLRPYGKPIHLLQTKWIRGRRVDLPGERIDQEVLG